MHVSNSIKCSNLLRKTLNINRCTCMRTQAAECVLVYIPIHSMQHKSRNMHAGYVLAKIYSGLLTYSIALVEECNDRSHGTIC